MKQRIVFLGVRGDAATVNMAMRTSIVIGVACLVAVPLLGAQQRGRGTVEPGVERLRAFDPAAVERGRSLFGEKCSSCHRQNARGGKGFAGPDLIRSALVLQDVNGRQIAAHLQTAHRPAIALSAEETSAIGTFLHREITYAAERTNYQLQYVMTGDARAGEAYFKGAGGCGRGRAGTGGPSRAARRATVTLPSGETVSGVLLRLTDFDVTIGGDDGTPRSWLRSGGVPKVTVTDPLQGHIDLLPKYTDAAIHDLAAYLATLK